MRVKDLPIKWRAMASASPSLTDSEMLTFCAEELEKALSIEDVRVLRVIEYVGTRQRIEENIERSIHGTKEIVGLTIRAGTIGEYPEILIKGGD